MHGPAPKSRRELQRAGSRRATGRGLALSASAGIPEPRGDLSPDVRREWDRLVELLEPLGILTPVDGTALTVLAELVVEERRLSAALRDHQPGTPEWKRIDSALTSCRKHLVALAARFGLTPADRTRATVARRPADENNKRRYFIGD